MREREREREGEETSRTLSEEEKRVSICVCFSFSFEDFKNGFKTSSSPTNQRCNFFWVSSELKFLISILSIRTPSRFVFVRSVIRVLGLNFLWKFSKVRIEEVSGIFLHVLSVSFVLNCIFFMG